MLSWFESTSSMAKSRPSPQATGMMRARPSTGARRSKGRFRDEDGEDWEDSGVFFRCVIIDSNYCIPLTLFFSRSSFSYSREFNTVTSPRTKESSSRSTPYCPYFLSCRGTARQARYVYLFIQFHGGSEAHKLLCAREGEAVALLVAA